VGPGQGGDEEVDVGLLASPQRRLRRRQHRTSRLGVSGGCGAGHDIHSSGHHRQSGTSFPSTHRESGASQRPAACSRPVRKALRRIR
jgi:hypothetical protein